jgi:hypothetical protein
MLQGNSLSDAALKRLEKYKYKYLILSTFLAIRVLYAKAAETVSVKIAKCRAINAL